MSLPGYEAIKPTVPNTATNYVQYNDLAITNNFLQVSFPAYSIQTFQVANVDLSAPTTPVVLSATAGSGIVYLNWASSAGATNYLLARATNSAGPYLPLSNLDMTSYSDTQVADGVT